MKGIFVDFTAWCPDDRHIYFGMSAFSWCTTGLASSPWAECDLLPVVESSLIGTRTTRLCMIAHLSPTFERWWQEEQELKASPCETCLKETNMPESKEKRTQPGLFSCVVFGYDLWCYGGVEYDQAEMLFIRKPIYRTEVGSVALEPCPFLSWHQSPALSSGTGGGGTL